MATIPSGLIIGGVTLLVALAGRLVRSSDASWFYNLQTPEWLTFEWAIPLIWTIIFICGAWSAYLVWKQNPGSSQTWLRMGLFLLLEIAIIAYIPSILWFRNLTIGTVVGGLGIVLGLLLIGLVWPVSSRAGLLLLPYLLWSPIGTFTTWQMIQLNPNAV